MLVVALDWYAEWVSRHVEVFGLSEQDTGAMLAWRKTLVARGCTVNELHDATEYLLMNPDQIENIFAGKMAAHLTAIQRRIRVVRAVEYRREVESNRELGTCVKCAGSGRVIVPHLRSVVNGEWRPLKVARASASHCTMAVVCSCRLGVWFGQRASAIDESGETRPMMALDRYERQNPDWEKQLAEHALRQVQIARSREPEAARDRTTHLRMDSTFDRLRKQYGLNG